MRFETKSEGTRRRGSVAVWIQRTIDDHILVVVTQFRIAPVFSQTSLEIGHEMRFFISAATSHAFRAIPARKCQNIVVNAFLISFVRIQNKVLFEKIDAKVSHPNLALLGGDVEIWDEIAVTLVVRVEMIATVFPFDAVVNL